MIWIFILASFLIMAAIAFRLSCDAIAWAITRLMLLAINPRDR